MNPPIDLLLRNVRIVTCTDDVCAITPPAFVAIFGGLIAGLGPMTQLDPDAAVVKEFDGEGALLTPGFIAVKEKSPMGVFQTNIDFANGGMKVFSSANCAAGVNATIQPWSALTPVQQAQFGTNLRYGFSPVQNEKVYTEAIEFLMKGQNQTNSVPAPACTQQAPFTPIGDESQPATQYLHVFREP